MVVMITVELDGMLIHLDCTWAVDMCNASDYFVHVHQMLNIHNDTQSGILSAHGNYDICNESQVGIGWNSIHDNMRNDALM